MPLRAAGRAAGPGAAAGLGRHHRGPGCPAADPRHGPEHEVIVITGNQDQTNALKAIDVGAFDFHHKPFEEQTLKIIIDRAYRVYELEQENRAYAMRSRSEPLRGLLTADPNLKALSRSNGNVAQAAALLGIARPTLYDLMNQLGLK